MTDGPIAVLLADGTLLTGADFEPVAGREGELRCRRPDLLLRLTVTSEPAHGGMVHQLTARNAGFGRIRLARLSPLFLSGDEAAPQGLAGVAGWIQGQTMGSPVYCHHFGTGEAHGDLVDAQAAAADEHRFDSAWMLISGAAESDEQTLLGFITTGRQFSSIRLSTDAAEERPLRLDCGCDLDGWTLGPGESVSTEKLLVLGPGAAVDLAEAYAAATGAEMRARVPAHVPSGWCSWYFFYNRVSEADVIANLDALVAQGRPVEVVQIDDGFQSVTGDWLTPNERFPSGMAALARRISEAGFTPGLWFAPFVMHRDSRVLAEHPEWALKNAGGAPLFWQSWLGDVAVLDCTHPGAREWLATVFRTATREWGYRYLKLDALLYASLPGARYHAPNTTAAANLRWGLEVIRAAAGDDTFILGCTCPFGPAIGLVDAMRVGPDVGDVWFNGAQPSVRQGLRLALPRFYMHRRFWLNDPDCLVARDVQSALSEDEARFLASGIFVSGGLVLLSDDLASLSPRRLPIAQAVLPPLGIAARPLDLLQRETPSCYWLSWRSGEDECRLLALFNWGDAPASFEVDLAALGLPGAVHAFEYWQQRYAGRLDGRLRERDLAPHSAAVYALRPERAGLQLLSVGGHLSQGAAQFEAITWPEPRTLRLRFAAAWTRPVRVWLRLPEGSRSLEVRPHDLRLEIAGAAASVTLDPAVAREWALRVV